MKIFVTSDTHFGHDRLTELSSRPRNFSERLMKSVAEKKGDLLIHCGDFCIGNDAEWADEWRDAASGFNQRVLVRGNHDKKSDAWYAKNAGFNFVCESFQNTYFGRLLTFSHIPCEKNEKTAIFRNIHGHMHGNMHRVGPNSGYDPKYHYDLAPELHDYKIINLEKILIN